MARPKKQTTKKRPAKEAAPPRARQKRAKKGEEEQKSPSEDEKTSPQTETYLEKCIQQRKVDSLVYNVHWPHTDPVELKKNFAFLDVVHSWAGEYADRPDPNLDDLTESQKQTLLKSLHGNCIQDWDWNTLMGHVPERISYMAATFFTEMIVLKDIFSKCVIHPFWYFDGKTGPEDAKKNDFFPAELNHLYEMFLSDDRDAASAWRADTIRLANIPREKTPAPVFGSYNKDRRDDLMSQFASDLLASEPLKWILRELPAEEEKGRHEGLLYCYREAAEAAVALFANQHQVGIDWINFEESNTFDSDSQTTKVVPDCHVLEPGDKKLDGKRILMAFTPNITISYNFDDDAPQQATVCSAHVVVDDNEPMDPEKKTVMDASIVKVKEEK
ncbi:hypothetical protein FE257_007944 [Aspergillus nanangensis]|uniref:Uncharacterized protein n=1 Tax=Aspergillus nanangensis TaxID=2582783 RepID=A0AAD4CXT7_ASPNN|nr:hypothetical protein FE257_007944 [Aspergillus nanangensis]